MATENNPTLPFLNSVVIKELPEGRGLFRLPPRWTRDFKICSVGDPGSGKSLGGGMISTFDHMLWGFPCFGNIDVRASFAVSDEIAARYGGQGGTITLESTPLDKARFLAFDMAYSKGVIMTHEFNIWLADARRSTSNLNLDADDISQQIRKLQSTWILDCLHEMFIDSRFRDYIDIFIRTEDVAFSQDGMARKIPQGVEFDWYIFPMTRKAAALLGVKPFGESGVPIGPERWYGKNMWGLIDTQKKEKREKYVRQSSGGLTTVESVETPEMTAAVDRYGFIYEAMKRLRDLGYDEIHNEELWEYLDLTGRDISKNIVGQRLREMGITKRQAPQSVGGFYYKLDNFDLKRGIGINKPRGAVLA